jgi:hypothetical protein
MAKKKITKVIQARVEDALADFSKDISDKKFKKHVKKAGKILQDGLELPEAASAVVKKKAKKKAE